MAHRVLYVVDSLGMGGAERGLVLTLRHLDRERVQPEVAMLWEPDALAAELRTLGIPVHRLRAHRGPAALLAVPRLARLLRPLAGAGDSSAATDVGRPGLAPGHGQDPLHRGRVRRVFAARRQPPAHGPAGPVEVEAQSE